MATRLLQRSESKGFPRGQRRDHRRALQINSHVIFLACIKLIPDWCVCVCGALRRQDTYVCVVPSPLSPLSGAVCLHVLYVCKCKQNYYTDVRRRRFFT
jgi:hypothetical protein